MEKNLTKAVAKSLLDSFENSKVFQRAIKQNLSDGDFLVGINSISSSLVPADYIKRTIEYSITAFTSDTLLEKLDVLIKMEKALKIVECEGVKIRGYFDKSKIEDNYVVLYPRYTFYTQDIQIDENNEYLMEKIKIN